MCDDHPLQKRILTILPVLLLCYTSLRFAQLQVWQTQTLPKELYGGVKGRRMTDSHSNIQLNIDHAKTSQNHIMGMKLDKAKCFDRLLPDITAALFLAFGLPQGLTRFFLQIYVGLKRYMTYKQWTSKVPSTCANGLAQGCSLSLIAINLHMTVWTLMIQHLPVSSSIFIDDSYLWTKVENERWLEEAMRLTNLWDNKSGQLLNQRKCQIWATNANARKCIRKCFPDMEFVHSIEILGARIQTTNQASFQWLHSKTEKVIQDIKNIAAIPCNRDTASCRHSVVIHSANQTCTSHTLCPSHAHTSPTHYGSSIVPLSLCASHTVLFTVAASHTQWLRHCTLHTLQTLSILWLTLSHSVLYCAAHTLRYTLCSSHSVLYSAQLHSVLYSEQLRLCSVQCAKCVLRVKSTVS